MTLEERVSQLEAELASLRTAPPDMQTLRIEAAIAQMHSALSNDLAEVATHVAAIERDVRELKSDVGASFARVFATLSRRPRWPWERTA